jgi:hypothetical protein
MGFPAGAQTTVLTMTVGLADGSAERETITITPSVPQIVSTALNDIREGSSAPITITPDRAAGTASVRLLNTDASGYNPSGWTYTVQRGSQAPYSISLPAALGATADLADLTPVTSSPGTYNVLFPVTGTPTAGQVPTATSATAASWQTPAGGGGASIKSVVDDRIDLEIVVLVNTASWSIVRTSGGTAIGKSIAAAAGDRVLVAPSFMYAGNQYNLDLAIMKGDGTISRYASSSGAGTTPGPEGYAPFYTQAASFPHASGIRQFVVEASEIDTNGLFTVNLAYIAPSLSGVDNKIYAGDGYLAGWFMANFGPQPT